MTVEMSNRSKRNALDGAANMIVKLSGFPVPEVELVRPPELRTSRFDAEALEYEITMTVRPRAA
jgi:hypothetical protein